MAHLQEMGLLPLQGIVGPCLHTLAVQQVRFDGIAAHNFNSNPAALTTALGWQ